MSTGASSSGGFDRPLTFSVILNTCDRRDGLRTALYALDRQTWRHFEVVVVVGPTRDSTLEMLESEFADRVVVARCPEFNLSCSRNVGLRHAAGDVVAFIDDDAVPCPTWLEQLAMAYLGNICVGVGGRTYQVRPNAGYQQHLHGRISVLAEQEDVCPDPHKAPEGLSPPELWFHRCHGTNMSYRRDALLAAGGFDERLEYLFDDSDSAVRLGLTGQRVATMDLATVYHAPGTGRNRGRHPYDLNWYCWLRSTVYFTLKNGVPTLGWGPSLRRATEVVSQFFSRIEELSRQGTLDTLLTRKARRMLWRGAVEGYYQGLIARRRLRNDLAPTSRALRIFLRDESPRRRFVPPTGLDPEERVEIMDESPLRVCLLSAGFPPRSTEGIARHTHMMALGLAELGHEVHVLTYSDVCRKTVREGYFVHEIKVAERERYRRFTHSGYRDLGSWLSWSHAVYDEVRALRIDHGVQVVDSPLWNLDGLVTAISRELPVVVRIATAMRQIAEIHGTESDESRILAQLEEEFLRSADAYVFNSGASIRALHKVYGITDRKVPQPVVPHGMVAIAEDDVTYPDGVGREDPTILFVGRLEKRKGVLELLEAFNEVHQRHPRARLLVAGSDNSHEDGFAAENGGLDYPGFFRKRYRSAATRVEFLGYVSEEHLQSLYGSCDLFVAPSRYESFGLIFLEAMNHGRPVIGCDAGGPAEIIVDGETGLLVPPEDPRSLAKALDTMLCSAELRRDMGVAARKRFLARYTHSEMARGFVEVYREVLARRGAVQPVEA